MSATTSPGPVPSDGTASSGAVGRVATLASSRRCQWGEGAFPQPVAHAATVNAASIGDAGGPDVVVAPTVEAPPDKGAPAEA